MTLLYALLFALCVAHALGAPQFPIFDFSRPDVCREWGALHDISALEASPGGLRISVTGADPYFFGPPRPYPTNLLWLELKLRSEAGGPGQVFWFTQNPREEESERFAVPPGEWTTVRLALPALMNNTRLRIDPPGDHGACTIASIRFVPRTEFQLPRWPSFVRRIEESKWARFGTLAVRPLTNRSAGFEIAVSEAGKPPRSMAVTHSAAMIGYVAGERIVWFDPSEHGTVENRIDGRGWRTTARTRDPDGAQWTFTQTLLPGPEGKPVEIEITATVDQDRQVMFLPLVFLVAGRDANKTQALFPGLEYLANEPSSSEADVIGPASRRFVPDNVKITQPYIAFADEQRWFSLMWEPDERAAAFFDSPDRAFGTGRHVMGLVFPGGPDANRRDGDWLPQNPARLKAGDKCVVRIAIAAGRGNTVERAARAYVAWRGLPAVPERAPGWDEYFHNTVAGWLDSKIREGNKVRHAVWQNFPPMHAADAAAGLEWLAAQTEDRNLIERLTNSAAQLLAPIPPEHWNSAEVSHVRMPWPALVFGHVAENQRAAAQHARQLLAGMGDDGIIRYRPHGDVDYARTHSTNHANGLVASVIAMALEEAVFSGSAELERAALEKLRRVNRAYAGSVPRGAQTWEVPLHTPDILSSAYLLRANALAFDLTRSTDFGASAEYWAWTGVPFVYLVNPAGRDIGLYTTIAVYGATQWKAPVWLGQPVQWCGLVYADALYRWCDVQPSQTWHRMADGIAAAGVQMSWPTGDRARVGLLPDVFVLRQQYRDGPAINPGTLQPSAARYYQRGPIYQCRAAGPFRVHAAGQITGMVTRGRRSTVQVIPWRRGASTVLITGVAGPTGIKVDGHPLALDAAHAFDREMNSLRLVVSGATTLELERGPDAGAAEN